MRTAFALFVMLNLPLFATAADPQDAIAHIHRGIDWFEKGEPDNAIKDFSEAIRLNPTSSVAFLCRGLAWLEKGDFVSAFRDYSEAIRLDPRNVLAYISRADAWVEKGELDNAIKDYTEAIRLDCQFDDAYNRIAWLRATWPDERYRDGKQAIEYATSACELSEWKDWVYLDTLAAAYAEAGDFPNAIKWAEKAFQLAPEEKKNDHKDRIELYRENKPYRDPREKLPGS